MSNLGYLFKTSFVRECRDLVILQTVTKFASEKSICLSLLLYIDETFLADYKKIVINLQGIWKCLVLK